MNRNLGILSFLGAMDDQKLEKLKIQLQQLRNEAHEFVQQIPPAQLFGAVGVVIFTIFFFLISKLTQDLNFFYLPIRGEFFVALCHCIFFVAHLFEVIEILQFYV